MDEKLYPFSYRYFPWIENRASQRIEFPFAGIATEALGSVLPVPDFPEPVRSAVGTACHLDWIHEFDFRAWKGRVLCIVPSFRSVNDQVAKFVLAFECRKHAPQCTRTRKRVYVLLFVHFGGLSRSVEERWQTTTFRNHSPADTYSIGASWLAEILYSTMAEVTPCANQYFKKIDYAMVICSF